MIYLRVRTKGDSMMLVLSAVALMLSNSSFASEADNFTSRSMNIVDIADPVNTLANEYLQEAVHAANETGACDEDVLYTELEKMFNNHSKGQLAKDLLFEKKFPVTVIPIKESVYKEWTVFDGYLLGRKKAAESALALSPMVRVGNQVVGVDKFEHMFGMGLTYFTKHYRNGKNLTSVIKNGVLREKTALGGNVFATGIFSYGDLSANFNGMRFWNHMLQKSDDILGKGANVGPYVQCKAGKWSANSKKKIDFRNYMDAALDESVNCSKFANRGGEKKFNRSLVRLGFVDSKGEAMCPVEPAKLEEMVKKYEVTGVRNYLINKKGNETVSYFSEIPKK